MGPNSLRLCFLVTFLLGFVQCEYSFNRVYSFSKDIRKLDEELSSPRDTTGKKWALLVAGSKYYYNYRHQADVCHAYQVLHKHGIPDEQIVVMMYDDIAHSSQNPFPGELINHPDGPNVYKGVPKDYVGEDVTPENFISILTGKKNIMKQIGSGKVIDSGPDDHVFVFFSDHGAPGLIAFPVARLYKDDLANAIKYMHENKKYSQLVFYIEACESGSMFYKNLKENINVFATTAANRSQSSYACYYDKKREAYLGDRYSVAWMEDSDQENLAVETLEKQYKIVKADTNQSSVQQFGDMKLSNEPVGFFQGTKAVAPEPKLRRILDDVPSPDVQIHVLKNKIESATTIEEQNRLRKELNEHYEMRQKLTNAMNDLAVFATGGNNAAAANLLFGNPELHDMSCYRTAVEWFDRVCFDLDNNDYAYRKLYVLGNLCDTGVPTDQILSSISKMCSDK